MRKVLTGLFISFLLMIIPISSWATWGDPVFEGVGITGKISIGSGTLEIPNSTSLPPTCVAGEIYMDTSAVSGRRCYLCESTNVWMLQGDGGGGGVSTSGTPIDNDFAKFTDADTIEGRSYSETRSDLGLGTAATRSAEDTMTDGNNLPDGHAIKTYGDANWNTGSGSLTTLKESGGQVGGADIVTLDFGSGFDLSESPNTEINVALDLTEYGSDYGSDSYTAKMFLNDNAPSSTCLWRAAGGGGDTSFNANAQAGASILEIRESSVAPGQAALYLERDVTGTSSTNFRLNPGCIYAETRTYNAQDKHDVGMTICAICENASINTTPADNWGYDDAVAIVGRGSKSALGYGDCCGVWGSMYRLATNPVMPRGSIMGVEAHIYENNSDRKMYGDRPSSDGTAGGIGKSCWSAGLHVYSDSTYDATAGIFIDANYTKAGFLNAILIDQTTMEGDGVVGTTGINMGSYTNGEFPQYSLEFGYGGEWNENNGHIYTDSNLKIVSQYEQFYYIDAAGDGTDRYVWHDGSPTAPTALMTLTSGMGNLEIDGVLTENAWTLNDKAINRKWELMDTILDAYRSHDGSKLDSVLQAKQEVKNENNEVTGIKYGKRPSDFIQIAIECIAELKEKTEEQALYILQLHERLKVVEAGLKVVEARLN